MGIQLIEKKKQAPKGPSELRELIPYQVVEAKDAKCGVETGDIVLAFPAQGGRSNYILNVTKQKMLWLNAQDRSWNEPFTCLRAHNVEQIVFTVDHDDRPE